MRIAVFYHCKLSGGGIPDPDFAVALAAGQLQALSESGLTEAAAECHIGVNGDESDALLAACFCPAHSQLHSHGLAARTEIPTMNLIARWVKTHPGWSVLYHHTKGVTHPKMESYSRWRDRMQLACVTNWRRCVQDLDSGADAVGCHWLTPERYPGAVTSPFFGGTFWWARSDYLRQLPPLPEATWQNRFEAESWIGRRRPYPKIVDYHPGWP